jgi:hypothetical protein
MIEGIQIKCCLLVNHSTSPLLLFIMKIFTLPRILNKWKCRKYSIFYCDFLECLLSSGAFCVSFLSHERTGNYIFHNSIVESSPNRFVGIWNIFSFLFFPPSKSNIHFFCERIFRGFYRIFAIVTYVHTLPFVILAPVSYSTICFIAKKD